MGLVPSIKSREARLLKTNFLPLFRYAVVGAEKLRPSIAQDFKSKFDIELFEGYGCTETGPVVAINTPNVRHSPGWIQKGHKFATVGTTLPGVATRIVDPETFAPIPFGHAGMLLVNGGSCMQGYLNQPEKTKQAFTREGWYITGDMAKVDEGGFITIVDRLTRFSKIGGGKWCPILKSKKRSTPSLGDRLQSLFQSQMRKKESNLLLSTATRHLSLKIYGKNSTGAIYQSFGFQHKRISSSYLNCRCWPVARLISSKQKNWRC
ncbi:MAG: AMP-binding protein [Pseudomonadota bacterium]